MRGKPIKNMVLSRFIPVHRKTVRLNWVQPIFVVMSPRYRKVRSTMSPMDTCYWCRHKFEDGEQMGLAQKAGRGVNVVICQDCIDEAKIDDAIEEGEEQSDVQAAAGGLTQTPL